jgi:hypothetical protein
VWINEALENKQSRSAAFLDISQAFNKVWQTGLLYKLRLSLPLNYLHSRHFYIKAENEYAELFPDNVGTPQGSALGPLLYLLYAADLPEYTTATFANNTAVLATDNVPAIASQKLQTNLAAIQYWFKKLRIKAIAISHPPHLFFDDTNNIW